MQLRFILIVGTILAVLAIPALAQVPPQDTTRGEIVNLNTTALTLKLQTGQHATFAIEGDTVMAKGLAKGDLVEVHNLPGESASGPQKALEIVKIKSLGVASNNHTLVAVETETQQPTAPALRTTTEVTTEVTPTAPATEDHRTVEVAQTHPATPPVASAPSHDNAYLPQTASPLAVLLIGGFLALGAGVMLRRFSL